MRDTSNEGRTEVRVTSEVTERLLRNNGAFTMNPRPNDSQTTRITINPGMVTRRFTMGEFLDGVLAGRPTILSFTPSEALIHEFGHANAGISGDRGVGYGQTDSEALKLENQHREMRGTNVKRRRHD